MDMARRGTRRLRGIWLASASDFLPEMGICLGLLCFMLHMCHTSREGKSIDTVFGPRLGNRKPDTRALFQLTLTCNTPAHAVAQRVQIQCYYGIRAQKPYMVWFWGPNSILAV